MNRFASDLKALHAFLENGGFIGTLSVKIPHGSPDGSDIRFKLPYPDWKNIGSHR